MSAVERPRFYPLIALALATFIIVGFSRTYYLRFLSDLPPMATLTHLHGLVFTVWVGLFVAQTRLIAAHRVDLHMKLGILSAAFAALVVAFGVAIIFATTQIQRVRPSGLTPAQFTIVPLTSIGLFAVFIALGVAFRRRAGLHRRFMVLAMIAVLGPAVARLLRLLNLRDFGEVLIPTAFAGFVAWCLIHDWRRHRIVHPVFAIGGLAIVASWPLRQWAARSEWYQPIGEWFVRVGAGS